MKRHTLLTSIATFAIAAAAPALAGPGNGNGGGHGGDNPGRGGMSEQGSTMRDMGRMNSQGAFNASERAMERANENSAILRDTTDTVRDRGRVKDDTDVRGNARVKSDAMTNVRAMGHGKVDLSGVTNGMTVVDSTGATVGTVTNIFARGNGGTRAVQVTLSDGSIVTLSPNSLSLDGDVLTTTSVATSVNSQGAANASINGLTHASPNSALAMAGVTSLTGLETGLTVNNSTGASIGTVSGILTNNTGAVIGVTVDLTGGGTATIPATTLSIDGSIVTTSSTQF